MLGWKILLLNVKYCYLTVFNMILLLTGRICRLEDEGLCRKTYTQINKHTYTHILAAHKMFPHLIYIMKHFYLIFATVPDTGYASNRLKMWNQNYYLQMIMHVHLTGKYRHFLGMNLTLTAWKSKKWIAQGKLNEFQSYFLILHHHHTFNVIRKTVVRWVFFLSSLEGFYYYSTAHVSLTKKRHLLSTS